MNKEDMENSDEVPSTAPAYPGAAPTYPGAAPTYPSAVPTYPDAAPAYPGAVSTYAINIDPQSQFQAPVQGWNATVFPPPPPYTLEPSPVPQEGINIGLAPPIILKTYLTDVPGQTVCPACNQPCITKIEYKSGCVVAMLCVFLFFIGCFLGCCLIPFCIKSFKDVDHFCPNCNHHIYKHKRL